MLRPVVGMLLAQVVLGVARPAMSYRALQLGADGFTIGLLAAAFAVVPMVLALPIGTVSGRLLRIGVMPLVSSTVLGGACILAATATEIWLLAIASALLGTGALGAALGIQAWIARSTPSTKLNSAFGWMGAAGSLGQAIGPLLSGIVIGPTATTRDGIMTALWIAAASGGLLAVCFVASPRRAYSHTDRQADARVTTVLRTQGVIRYTFISATVLTAVDILTTYLPLIGELNGLPPIFIGTLLAIRGVTSMISRVLLGPLSRLWSLSLLVRASTAGSAASLIVVAALPWPVPLTCAMVVGGFFLGIAQPLTITAIVTAVSHRARSTALGARMLGNLVGQAILPVLAGSLSLAAGAGVVFLGQALALTAATVWEQVAQRGGSKGGLPESEPD